MEIRRGHLYIADMNPRWGTKPGKYRPVVVIQNDLLNETHSSTWILPCTTQVTPPNILRVHLPEGCAGNHQSCDIMMDQSRAIDNRRFKKYLGQLPHSLWEETIEKLKLVGDL